MLNVDLGVLARDGRVRIDAEVPAADPLWEGMPWRFDGPVMLRLDLQQAMQDVVVRGHMRGNAVLECRRCLQPVTLDVDEDLSFLYRPGLSEADAEAEELYVLPARAQELDLTEAVREHVVLAVPQFAICDEACRGLCARCGTNLNESSCDCVVDDEDPRWAALRKLGSD